MTRTTGGGRCLTRVSVSAVYGWKLMAVPPHSTCLGFLGSGRLWMSSYAYTGASRLRQFQMSTRPSVPSVTI
jgi:hypothetical protein